jgi:hypothetical protein
MEAQQLNLEPGRVYRTKDLAHWDKNTPRLAKKLVKSGRLVRVRQGLFAAPKSNRFGEVPPTDDELMTRFLEGSPFVFTGPERWNALGLGTTAVFASRLVYNRKRTGTFTLYNRRFDLRRVAFPENPTREWFVVDLFEHADQAATSRADLARELRQALKRGAFDSRRLLETAQAYGTKETQSIIRAATEEP